MISFAKSAAVVCAVILVLSAGAAVPAAAQESEIAPEHLAAARTYVDLTDQSSIYETSLITTAINTMRTILRTNPDLTEPVDQAITKALETYRGRKDELMDQFARVYALNFTMEELQEINRFYESEVGRKLVTANATLNEDMQRIVGVFENNLSTEFFAMVRANLKEAGYNV
jgi:hypothetical protein